MEEKIIKRGGPELRHQFFQYLQRKRDQVRSEHQDCDRGPRAFLADRLTWQHFCEFLLGLHFASIYTDADAWIIVNGEPFPGKEPVGGHTRACKDRSGNPNTTPVRSKQPMPLSTAKPIVRLPPALQSLTRVMKTQPRAETPTPRQAFKIPSPQVDIQSPVKMEQPPADHFLTVQGNLLRCSIADLKNVAYSIVKDDKYEMVAKALNCKFKVSQRGKNSGLRLAAVATEDAKIWGAQFLKNWAMKLLKDGEPIEMSSYWLSYCRKSNPLPQSNPKIIAALLVDC